MTSMQDFNTLEIYKAIQNKSIREQVDEIIECATPLLAGINGCFKNYTLHDINHSYRVAKYMGQMVLGKSIEFNQDVKTEFSDLDFAIMIICAVLHDIGMYVDDQEKKEIRTSNKVYLNEFTYQGIYDLVKDDEEAIKEIVRRTHHLRIKDKLNIPVQPNSKRLMDIMCIDHCYDYSSLVEQICMAHGQEHKELNNIEEYCEYGEFPVHARYIAALLRIGDLLDIDGRRAPIILYKLNQPYGYSETEWQKHFEVTNYDKFNENKEGKLCVKFFGKSSLPTIHRKYLSYCDYLRKELSDSESLFSNSKYHVWKISSDIINNVTTQGFKCVDLKFNMNYSSITELLMGANLYDDKRLGLRELIQNAIDACRHKEEIIRDNIRTSYAPQIKIFISKTDNTVQIHDNGIGMDMHIIKDYFLNVGVSYYTSQEFKMHNYSFLPIGKYGIGFLSCCLLSNKINVITRRFDSNSSIEMDIERGSEFVVIKNSDNHNIEGTMITLNYNEFFSVFNNIEDVRNFISKSFLSNIKISIIDLDTQNDNVEDIVFPNATILKQSNSSDEKLEVVQIKCEQFDKESNGVITLLVNKDNSQIFTFDSGEVVYLYDKVKNTFILTPYEKLSKKEYRMLIFSKKKSQKSAINTRENKSNIDMDIFNYKFLVTTDVRILNFRYDCIINGIELQTILENSQINLTSDYLIGVDIKQFTIFVENNQFVLLNLMSLRRRRTDVISILNMHLSQARSLFYRDVYVNDCPIFYVAMPMDINVINIYINLDDKENNIHLNVARSKFINNGEDQYIDKIVHIIYNYCEKYLSNNELIKSYYEYKKQFKYSSDEMINV